MKPAIKPMTIAELKRRLVPGTRLRLMNSLMGPCDKARKVEKTNTVEFMLSGDGIQEGKLSHAYWPKKGALFETADGFEIYDEEELALAYKWEKNETE